MTSSEVELNVNGRRRIVDADADVPLIYALRNDLDLKGVRSGCGTGVCGSCTVLADGKPLKSCVMPVGAVTDAEIITPERLGRPEHPHAVQAAFVSEQAAQCGYCVNGIIMSTVAAATRTEAPDTACPPWLTEHLCRCGTHPRIRRAIDRAVTGGPVTPIVTWTGAPELHDGGDAVAEGPLPEAHPSDRVETWIRLLPDGRIQARTGKVELGQGIRTAIAQIVAAQIGVPLSMIVVSPVVTTTAPDEAYTAGSNSVDRGGSAIAKAAAGFRRLLLQRAAERLSAPAPELSVSVDRVTAGDGSSVSLAVLAADGDLIGGIEPTDVPDWAAAPIGEPVPRDDLLPKLTGAPAFVHDLALPGMLHARALLPPHRHAEVHDVDTSAVDNLPGIVQVIVDYRLIIVVAEREEQAVRAVARLRRTATWDGPTTGVDSTNIHDAMRSMPAYPHVARADEASGPPSHRATYHVPYQAHAAVAPSCAVAVLDADITRVWTHTQGIHPLRRALAGLLGVDFTQVAVAHRDGPGCYGYNLADDAAALAALAAHAVPGHPVRFLFTVEDEFGWEPYGPAMIADLEASVASTGWIGHWSHRSITDTTATRPRGDSTRLMPAWLGSIRADPDWPGPTEAGARNAEPIYDIPAVTVVADHVRGPLRTGPLRAPGSYLNTFASESFMDELASYTGVDPLEFRLRHLTDQRARAVLEAAASGAGWKHRTAPSGRGLGLAMARFKRAKAYVAVAAEAAVHPESARVRVKRLVVACDAGTVINPDGLSAQLEGGALQGLSRALYEEIKFDTTGRVTTTDWLSYPVIGFSDVPDTDVILLNPVGEPPLGAGEAALGPAAAALANALDDFVGVRFRDLPLTPDRIRRRLEELDENEADRVLLG